MNLSTTTSTIKKRYVQTENFKTYVNESGNEKDKKVIFIHGSGPGVTALANWNYALESCQEQFHCIAPDLFGFANSSHPNELPENRYDWLKLWVKQIIQLMDELKIEEANLVGNSLGCAIAMELLIEHPERFDRVILMGPGGTPVTKKSAELARAQNFYQDPTIKKLRQIMELFVYDVEKMTPIIDSFIDERFEIALKEEVKRSNNAFFSTTPLPVPPTALKRIKHEILLVHGKEDYVCSVDSSYYLLDHLPNANLFVLGQCGHWAQLEHKETFNQLAKDFFNKSI